MSTSTLLITIDGKPIQPLSATVLKTMDTADDNWAAPIAWTPGLDPELDLLILPYKYPTSKVYIDGNLQITGPMYTPEPSISANGRTVNLNGASHTADIIDSTTKPNLYTEKNSSLLVRANNLVAPAGIKALLDSGTNQGGLFKEMTIQPTERIFDHLLQYASQRGIMISSTADGNLLFHVAKTGGAPVDVIKEGDITSATGFSASYDGRKLYNTYRAIRDTPDKSDPRWWRDKGGKTKSGAAISKDDNVPKSRFLTFKANETTAGDLQKAADHARSAIYAEALTMTLTVPRWTTTSGDVWETNTLVSVTSETLMIPDGFTFLIRAVEFVQEGNSQTANLSLVPPQVYSSEPIPYIWSVKSSNPLLTFLQ